MCEQRDVHNMCASHFTRFINATMTPHKHSVPLGHHTSECSEGDNEYKVGVLDLNPHRDVWLSPEGPALALKTF